MTRVQEFSADNTTNVHVFNYDASDSDLKRFLVPPLNYVAPELIAGTRATGALTSATDTYSFGESHTSGTAYSNHVSSSHPESPLSTDRC